jgi:uncharacterized protein YqgC (DUF456 family)
MAASPRPLTPLIGAGIVAAAAVIGPSSFFAFIGLPYSYSSISLECSKGAPCIQTSLSSNQFVPAVQAYIPLALGGLIVYSMYKGLRGVAWAGIIGLLIFSFLSLPSIGVLYLPFAIALVGINAYARNDMRGA